MTKRLMEVFLLGLFLVSCSDASDTEKCLDIVESQMSKAPEESLRILDSLGFESIPTPKLRARYSFIYDVS